MNIVYDIAARAHGAAPSLSLGGLRADPRLRAAPTDSPARSFAYDVLQGLAQRHKNIPSTWLYDPRGLELFEAITRLDAYYPARNEALLLERCASEITRAAGPGATLIDLGSRSRRQSRLLQAALDAPAALAGLPPRARPGPGGRRVVFLPSATIGSLPPDAATTLLQRIDAFAGPDALLVVGADVTHDPAVLMPVYDDAQGVTAAFNKNLLVRINRELGGDFTPSAFRHEARWNVQEQRVEMHLVSEYTQRVKVRGRTFQLGMGESIHTENAHKYSLVGFQALARRAGWSHLQFWTDAQARMAVHVLEHGHPAPEH